jgi:NAD(P)-dependent dehydrogenase (short-subunit alcohol dehydrogenase family)
MAAPFPSPTQTWHTEAYSKIDPKRPELSAKGKNIVITGGGIGLGTAIVRSFAEAGASTIGILGRTESALLKTKENIETEFGSTKVVVLVADVSDEGSVTKALNSFKNSVGLINVLVHNAAYMSDLLPVQDAEASEWFKSFEVRCEATKTLCQAKANPKK